MQRRGISPPTIIFVKSRGGGHFIYSVATFYCKCRIVSKRGRLYKKGRSRRYKKLTEKVERSPSRSWRPGICVSLLNAIIGQMFADGVGHWGREVVGHWGREVVGHWGRDVVGHWGREVVGHWGREVVGHWGREVLGHWGREVVCLPGWVQVESLFGFSSSCVHSVPCRGS